MKRKPLVALVGRPNVGKSTLFNRLIGEKKAIIEDLPGTTRDRVYGESEWVGRTFNVVDTGGLVLAPEDDDAFTPHIREQALLAMNEADIIVFMVDGSEGVTAADEEVAELLRRTEKPVILAVNKTENEERRLNAAEFYALGLGDPIEISAIHGMGTGDLLDAVVAHFPPGRLDAFDEEDDESVRIAIVGRPNVGKSSLLNRILGQDRSIVSDVPGTTRDAIDTRITYYGHPITLIDTAGIRRRGRIQRGVEKYSVLRSMRAIDRAHVALLVIDATEGVTAQDAHIAGYILDAYKSVIVVVNKWDLIEKETYTMLEYEQRIRAALNFMDYVPLIFVSAKTGQRVAKILDLVLTVYEERFKRIPTGEFNRLLTEAQARHAPPSEGRRKLRIKYGTQAEVDPPTFVLFMNHPDLMHFSYERYLENRIRERYTFLGTPLRFRYRRSDTHEKKEVKAGRKTRTKKR
nr:ribosome biogenesis GTPase Der [Ardenticatena sp.]